MFLHINFYYYCYNITRNTEEHKHGYIKEKFSGDSVKEYIINKFPNQRDLIEATIDATGTAATWYGVGNTVGGGVKSIVKKVSTINLNNSKTKIILFGLSSLVPA